jgi:hypothetical protein
MPSSSKTGWLKIPGFSQRQANTIKEPSRQTVRAIMVPRRAAHSAR